MTTEPASARGGSIIGTRVLRSEDPALLTGERRYLADLPEGLPHEGLLHARFVRSPFAHGHLRSIDTDEASGMPGVHAIWTADDLGIAPHAVFVAVAPEFLRPPLAVDRVRFAGEAVAVVFADTPAHAADAADAVWVDIDPLDAVVDPEEALGGGEVIFPAHGNNIARTEAPDQPIDLDQMSDRVVRGRYVNQRVAVAPMEPNSCAAVVGDDGRLTVWVSNQMPHGVHTSLSKILGIDPTDLRVVTPQVGGGFGGKAGTSVEYTVVAHAARSLGRPVVWVPTRSEEMSSMPHSRGQVQYVELGMKDDGTFTGLRVRLVADSGAYPDVGAWLSGGTRRMSPGTYNMDAVDFTILAAVTNTGPMGAYRGAGRPEATALIERAVDQAARESGIDPIELRLKNLIGDDSFPFTTLTGNVYDSGEYRTPLQVAADAIGYDEVRAEQAQRRTTGATTQLGIGVAAYVEITAGGGGSEFGRVAIDDDGSATMYAGTLSHGQGHQTAYAMLVSAQTGIPVEQITLVDGDTDRVPRGGGTGGSRSLQLAGSAIEQATETVVDRAKQLAATMLEADVADIVVDTTTGTVGVAGVPASALTWGQLAAQADDDGEPLSAESIFDQAGATFPFGAHIAVVEVDTDTGRARLIRHVAVDDCGTVLNPLLVEGQQHGGIASGIGQALYEEVLYDDGNLITGNLADYGLPSAAEMPSFDTRSTETPTPLNPLGAKGIGEAATIGSTPAIQNAVIDAVSHLGVRHIDMPCTPARVWGAIQQAAIDADPWRDPPAAFDAVQRDSGSEDAKAAEAAEAADGI